MTSGDYDSIAVNELLEGASDHIAGLVDLIKRTGAFSMQMREVDDPSPTIWAVVVEHYLTEDGMPTTNTEDEHHVEATAASDLGTALKRMVELLFDGALCMHCHGMSAFYDGLDGDIAHLRLLGACVTYWNGEKYVRSCQEKS